MQDKELSGFSEQAKTDLIASVEGYKQDLVKEINRIEAGQNPGSGEPEVTSSMVADAETIFARGKMHKKQRVRDGFFRAIAAISLFTAGAMIDKTAFASTPYLVGFIVILIVAISSNFYVYMKES